MVQYDEAPSSIRKGAEAPSIRKGVPGNFQLGRKSFADSVGKDMPGQAPLKYI